MNDIEEITVIFTKHCNLKCAFYNVIYKQHLNDDINRNVVMSKLEHIQRIIESTSKSTINIVLMGGELFCDDIDDDVIQSYHDLLKQVEQCCTINNKRLTVSLMSNLITKKVQRIIKLAKSFDNCDIHGSFDFVGRFANEHVIELWQNNAYAIKQAGIPFFVSIVGHQHNINRIFQFDETQKRLYSEFGVYVQYYEPVQTAPDDSLMELPHIAAILVKQQNGMRSKNNVCHANTKIYAAIHAFV